MPTQRHPLSEQDLEQLSAYMDGALSDSENTALEMRLNADSNLRAELEALRQTAQAVASLPKLRAPRNFTLTHEMLGIAPKPAKLLFFPTTAAFSAMSAVASIVFFIIGVSLLSSTFTSTPTAPIMSSSEIALAPTVTEAIEVQTQTSFAEGGAAGSSVADSTLEGDMLRERALEDTFYPAPVGGMAEFMSTPAPQEEFFADESDSAYRTNATPESTEEASPMLMHAAPVTEDETEAADAVMPEAAFAASGIVQEVTPEVTLEATAEATLEPTQEVTSTPETAMPAVPQNDTNSIGGVIILLAALLALALAILTTVIRLKNR